MTNSLNDNKLPMCAQMLCAFHTALDEFEVGRLGPDRFTF